MSTLRAFGLGAICLTLLLSVSITVVDAAVVDAVTTATGAALGTGAV